MIRAVLNIERRGLSMCLVSHDIIYRVNVIVDYYQCKASIPSIPSGGNHGNHDKTI